MKYFIGISFLFMYFFSNSQDKKNISVHGKIFDTQSKEMIGNAKVVAICWYTNNNNVSFLKEEMYSDENGNYFFNFPEGYRIGIASQKDKFIPTREYRFLDENKIEVNLSLKREDENVPNVKALLNTDHYEINSTEQTPFLRIKIQSNKNSDDTTSSILTYGFDFKNLKLITDTSISDIWFSVANNKKSADLIASSKSGGIYPVYSDEIKSSFLYESSEAPVTKYFKEYKLTGKEAGFFVLCRDGKTYGKIVLEKSKIHKQSFFGNLFYEEFGINFSALYQPDGSRYLFLKPGSIDLENFLTNDKLK